MRHPFDCPRVGGTDWDDEKKETLKDKLSEDEECNECYWEIDVKDAVKEFNHEIMRFREMNGTNHIRYNNILAIHRKIFGDFNK